MGCRQLCAGSLKSRLFVTAHYEATRSKLFETKAPRLIIQHVDGLRQHCRFQLYPSSLGRNPAWISVLVVPSLCILTPRVLPKLVDAFKPGTAMIKREEW